jgi:demethylsterigmatocystin 6-O-methyltransferase
MMKQYIQLAALRIGIDLNLFSFLPENRTPLTVSELAQKTGADPVLLGE